jgi:hypothetical protein
MPAKPHDRVLATVNKRVDVLEHERSHGWITEQAAETGREFQRLHELVDSVPSSNWEGRSHVDAAAAHEEAIARRHVAVHTIQRYRRQAIKRIGLFGWWFLRRAIVEGVSFQRLGADNGYPNEKGREWAARTFRRLLEEMSLAVGATGAPERKR